MVLQLNNRQAFSVYFLQQGTHPIGQWTLTSSSFPATLGPLAFSSPGWQKPGTPQSVVYLGSF